jgi:hypothetical protein
MATLDSKEVILVENFNGQFFQLWMFQMTFIFQAKEVWSIVNGRET